MEKVYAVLVRKDCDFELLKLYKNADDAYTEAKSMADEKERMLLRMNEDDPYCLVERKGLTVTLWDKARDTLEEFYEYSVKAYDLF